MKIGMFTDIYRPAVNGVTRSIDLLKENLEARGHTVYVFAPAVRRQPKEAGVIRLPSIKRLSPIKEAPIGFAYVPFMTRRVRPLELDVVHTHLPFFIGALGYRVANRLRLPKIHTYHTHLTEYAHYAPPVPGIRRPVRFGLKRLSKRYCNGADYVIAPSTAIERLLVSYGVTKPIVVNPTGIVCEEFRRLDSQQRAAVWDSYRVPSDQRVILFGGRLAKEKNLLFLVRCFAAIAETDHTVHLVFAGGGPFEGALRRHIHSAGLATRATITGFLSKEQIAACMGAAEIFAFPSYTETQGIVLAEALAAGCPVVAIDALGPKDAVRSGRNGYLVPLDEPAFTDKLRALLADDDLRARMSQAAVEDARQFSVAATTDRLLGVYEQAMHDRRLAR